MTTSDRRQTLLDALTGEEAALVHLNEERDRIGARIVSLRTSLATLDREELEGIRVQFLLPPARYIPSAPEEKVALFRSLFRGREDVYPVQFTSRKTKETGKPGYAPACASKFVRGVCGLPKVKCGECPNRAFLPVTDDVVRRHLEGRHVIGVYPLIADDTCTFLAADFDKACWAEDAAAFRETCKQVGLPVAIERSRSGNGAHAWFFFKSPVLAVDARKMGCFLITETMAQRHQLSMGSYDRLFPNQDTLPRGGFGNLIALPLQWRAREQGNSLFVDEALTPWPDKWAFLASIERIDPTHVRATADEAARRGQVIGVRTSDTTDGDGRTPWKMSPSDRPRLIALDEPLPSVVRAVLAQRLFVEKTGLPSSILNRIKRLAAFQNPQFHEKQRMRLSTATTPRVISCAEDLADHIALPRGCLPQVVAFLGEHGASLDVADKREDGPRLDLRFRGSLTPVQERAASALLAHETGILVAPPGVGKTVVGTYLVAARARATLVLVHRAALLDQWVAQLSMFLDLDPSEVGEIGAGKRKPNGRLDVAMIQSLVRKGRVSDLVAGYGHVIVDECHHVGAYSFERVLSEVKGRYVTGLTATPRRRDGHHPIVEMQLGAVRLTVDPKSQAARRPFEHKLVVRETASRPSMPREDASIQDLYAALAADDRRNDLIFDDVVGALEEGRSPIILTERRDHLEHLAGRLRKFTRRLVVLHGGMRRKERRDALAALAAIPDGEERLLLATGRYVGEGFDDARLDTLFLAMPISWKGTLIQYTGRLHRLHSGKAEVRIYDYVDRDVPMLLGMFKKRLRGYRAIGYARDEAPLGLANLDGEPVVEYDEDALRAWEGEP